MLMSLNSLAAVETKPTTETAKTDHSIFKLKNDTYKISYII